MITTRRKVFYTFVVLAPLILTYAARYDRKLREFSACGSGTGGVEYVPHDQLGYLPKPNASGTGSICPSQVYQWSHDQLGTRRTHTAGKLKILTLGCSFTYGIYVSDDQTWSSWLGRRTHSEVTNAGICGQGLAAMVLRARELIPIVKPHVVVVQATPWLVERCMMHAWRHPDGTMTPLPFFARDLVIEPAAFRGRKVPGCFVPALKDLIEIRLLFASRPSSDFDGVAQCGYMQLRALARVHGAKIVAVTMGATYLPNEREAMFRLKMILNGLSIDTADAYGTMAAVSAPIREWHLYDGERYLDAHPNTHAHAVISYVAAEAVNRVVNGN